MKKIKINKLRPTEIIDTRVSHGFCPSNVIGAFLKEYPLEKIRVLLFQMQMLSVFGRYEVPMPIETDDEGFFDFRKELEDLLKAVYLDHRYNNNKPIKFVDKGGKYG